MMFTGQQLLAGARAAEDNQSQGPQQDGAGNAAAAEQILPSHLQPRPARAQTCQGKYFTWLKNLLNR